MVRLFCWAKRSTTRLRCCYGSRNKSVAALFCGYRHKYMCKKAHKANQLALICIRWKNGKFSKIIRSVLPKKPRCTWTYLAGGAVATMGHSFWWPVWQMIIKPAITAIVVSRSKSSSPTKSRWFRIHKNYFSDPVRLSRLLLAAYLAYLWMVCQGLLVIAYWDQKRVNFSFISPVFCTIWKPRQWEGNNCR